MFTNCMFHAHVWLLFCRISQDNPAQRRVELKQRRRVKIIDGVPCLYTCSNPLTVLYNLEYMNKNKKRKIKKKKNEVISEEEQKEYERGAEMSKRHQEEDEKAFTSGVPMMVLEDWDWVKDANEIVGYVPKMKTLLYCIMVCYHSAEGSWYWSNYSKRLWLLTCKRWNCLKFPSNEDCDTIDDKRDDDPKC